jgi:dolichol kinase
VYNNDQMLDIVVSALCIIAIVAGGEYLFRNRKVPAEIARKSIHASCGVFIAFLPLWMSYQAIVALSILLVLGNIANHKLKKLKSISSIKRQSRGDVIFGIGIMLCAMFEPPAWIFIAAVLHLAIADSLAAVVGEVIVKRRGSYHILGNHKTVFGTITFAFVSLLVVGVAALLSGTELSLQLLWVPLIATVTENLSSGGYDNATIPFFVMIFLMTL